MSAISIHVSLVKGCEGVRIHKGDKSADALINVLRWPEFNLWKDCSFSCVQAVTLSTGTAFTNDKKK